uniref:F-box/LRR-repeat protein n=1 Tax=Angiostrongylus costaricensis TaxID=334426 RepID=A0A0R3Q0N3_ANGCS
LVADLLDVKCIDIYPYENVHILPYLHERIPNLTTLNMRPHSNQFHSSGLQLPSFPAFTKLTTLILDNYSVDGDFQLPSTIKSLEFSKREQTHYRFLLPKLANLSNLEYFTLSHADLSDANDFRTFVRAVNSMQLPKLTILASFITDVILFRALIVSGQLLMLRECKFVECDVVSIDVLKHLSMITWRQDADTGTLDECYSKLMHGCQETLKGKNARFISKMFSTGEEGKEIVVTELETMKSLIVRDYIDHQKYLTLGFIVGEHNSFEDRTTS